MNAFWKQKQKMKTKTKKQKQKTKAKRKKSKTLMKWRPVDYFGKNLGYSKKKKRNKLDMDILRLEIWTTT